MSGTGLPSSPRTAASTPASPADAAPALPRGATTADSIPIPDPRAALLGTVVDGFAIDAILGSGGCGTVYRGRQLGLDRPVAIKVPTFDVVDDPVLKKRFLREARAAARVRHPSVVTIYGVGEVPDGRPYLAMELLGGVSLAQVLDDGPLPVDRALGLARKIALALTETHAAGVVHRDLKPSNIIWQTDRTGADTITIVDFGIAAGQQGSADATRLTAGGKVIGTPHYMAPEQAQGEHRDIDHRTDLYALGCVLFELLTGEVPFDGAGFEVVLAHMTRQPPAPSSRRPGIPPAVDALVAGLLRKRAEERIGSAEVVVARIDQILAQLGPGGAERTDPAMASASVTVPALATMSEAEPADEATDAATGNATGNPTDAATGDASKAGHEAPPARRSPPAAGQPGKPGAAAPAAIGAASTWRAPLGEPASATRPEADGRAAPGFPALAPWSLADPIALSPRGEAATRANANAKAHSAGQVRTMVTARQAPRWRVAAGAGAVVTIALCAVVALRWMREPARPAAPEQPEQRDVMMGSENVSMRMRLPARLTAGMAAAVELELWNESTPLTDEEIVITVQDPAGKFAGFDAKAKTLSGYSFSHKFEVAGHHLIQVNVPVDDTTFEVDLDVLPAVAGPPR
ncbi:MAG: protein kinase [Myxococcales bacterium]|nr:protein kinase [Myxococcales bacterium]